MPIVNTREFEWAFSLNKQSDILTAITVSQINKMLPQRGFQPFMLEHPNSVSDRQWYGKGRSFPTFRDIVTKDLVIPSREFSMTQLSALFAPAFVMGKLSSNNTTGAVWTHTLTFQDPLTTPSVLFTTLIEKAGGEYQNKLSGAYLSQFAIKANRTDHVTMTWQGKARAQASDATSLPALSTGQSFFKLLQSTFKFGASGGSSGISAEVLEFNMTVSQNPQEFWLPGAASGQENLLAKVLIGDQTVQGDITIFMDSTLRNLFLNQTECELIVYLYGDQIASTGYYQTITITIPHFKLSSENISDLNSTAALKLTFDQNSVLKNAASEFMSWAVQTDVTSAELLVAA
jgi:hypothetical protein